VSSRLVFTIFTKRYLAHARTLSESLRATNPHIRQVAILLDEPEGFFDPRQEPFEIIQGAKLVKERIGEKRLFTSSSLETSCRAKALFAQHLLETQSVSQLLYLDSDILVLHSLDELFERFQGHSLVLFPQALSSHSREKIFLDRNLIRTGIFNGGMFGVSSDAPGLEFLNWWFTRTLGDCSLTSEYGGYLDQKWLNLAPIFFPSALIYREPDCNIAAWNLFERSIQLRNNQYFCNEKPVITWHLSTPGNSPEGVFRYPCNASGSSREAIQAFYTAYFERLTFHGFEQTRGWPYSFDFYTCKRRVSLVERKLAGMFDNKSENHDSIYEQGQIRSLGWWLERLTKKLTVSLFRALKLGSLGPLFYRYLIGNRGDDA
jgi:hypothetical protein